MEPVEVEAHWERDPETGMMALKLWSGLDLLATVHVAEGTDSFSVTAVVICNNPAVADG